MILLGDLNVDEYHLGELGRLPNITHVIAGVATNTRGTKAYDNILMDRVATAEHTGRWGVLDLLVPPQSWAKSAAAVKSLPIHTSRLLAVGRRYRRRTKLAVPTPADEAQILACGQHGESLCLRRHTDRADQ